MRKSKFAYMEKPNRLKLSIFSGLADSPLDPQTTLNIIYAYDKGLSSFCLSSSSNRGQSCRIGRNSLSPFVHVSVSLIVSPVPTWLGLILHRMIFSPIWPALRPVWITLRILWLALRSLCLAFRTLLGLALWLAPRPPELAPRPLGLVPRRPRPQDCPMG